MNFYNYTVPTAKDATLIHIIFISYSSNTFKL